MKVDSGIEDHKLHRHNQSNSLKFRLAFSAVLLLIILLPGIGFTLINVFEKHLIAATEAELTAQSYSLLADAEYFDNALIMPEQVMESRFNVIDSGLYAIVIDVKNKNTLWQSASALNFSSPINLQTPIVGERGFYQVNGITPYFVLSFSVSFSGVENELPVTLHLINHQQSFLNSVNEFKRQLFLWLAVIAVMFIAMTFVWLRWTLKPLTELRRELSAIEQGNRESIVGSYPIEVLPVTEQLNHLLKTEQGQRLRYRNALSDLAHALKTPLATIKTSVSVSTDITYEVDKINNIVEHQLKRAQSAGQSSWRLSVDIAPCVEKLTGAFAKIYRDKNIVLSVTVAENTTFKGDEADLLEMLGNLIDNAYKAAKSKVAVNVAGTDNQLMISVSDDGQGVAEHEKVHILKRGLRADTYEQGHGIGLAIVRDLVTSYQGEIDIDTDIHLGGAKFSLLFSV